MSGGRGNRRRDGRARGSGRGKFNTRVLLRSDRDGRVGEEMAGPGRVASEELRDGKQKGRDDR